MKRLLFIDHLRGIASASVLLVHICAGFWAWRPLIAKLLYAPELTGPDSPLVDMVSMFNFGPFGVSCFFLVSGFAVYLSAADTTTRQFLTLRLFRIYPTYITCLCVTAFSSWLSSIYWGGEFYLDKAQWLANALLLQNEIGAPSVDIVNWTLTVEVKFYLIVAALISFNLNKNPLSYLTVAIAILIISTTADFRSAFSASIRDLCLAEYIFIGAIFGAHYSGKIENSTAAFYVASLLLIWIYIAYFYKVRINEPLPVDSTIYVLNVGVFAFFYSSRNHFKPGKVTSFLARISYPQYCIHFIVGSAILRVLLDNGVNPIASVTTTIFSIFLISTLIHLSVETPSIQYGKKLSGPRKVEHNSS